MSRIDWNEVVDVAGTENVASFAAGYMSGRTLTTLVTNTTAAGEVRSLLRNRGVTEARRVARKAMTRRGYEFV